MGFLYDPFLDDWVLPERGTVPGRASLASRSARRLALSSGGSVETAYRAAVTPFDFTRGRQGVWPLN